MANLHEDGRISKETKEAKTVGKLRQLYCSAHQRMFGSIQQSQPTPSLRTLRILQSKVFKTTILLGSSRYDTVIIKFKHYASCSEIAVSTRSLQTICDSARVSLPHSQASFYGSSKSNPQNINTLSQARLKSLPLDLRNKPKASCAQVYMCMYVCMYVGR